MYQLQVDKETKDVIEMALIHQSMGIKDELAENDYSDELTLKRVAELRATEKATKAVFRNWKEIK